MRSPSATPSAPGRTPRPRRHRRQSQLGDHHRRRRQCRQSLALRPDPERPADRHHNADHLVACESPASGDLNAGNTVTLTLNLNEAVTVAGGTPTLTLNDGGTATYTGGSGTNALTFSYTVGAGQNTAASPPPPSISTPRPSPTAPAMPPISRSPA